MSIIKKNKHPLAIACACVLWGVAAAQAADDATMSDKNNFELKVLHINDHHSHLIPGRANVTINGEKTRMQLGGFPQVVSKIKALDNTSESVLKLHAGDAITGTLYFTLFEGEADAALMNQICFDAFALGNHEFDRGDAGLNKFIDYLDQGTCAKEMPILAANVHPEPGVSALTPDAEGGHFQRVQPYSLHEYVVGQESVVNAAGETEWHDIHETVAVIGLVIANKTKQSSNPDASTEFLDEIETAQRYIDELRSEKGVNKIIVLSHYQYENDLKMAQALDGVDVIVGGDSHSLLGDFAAYGLPSVGEYPTRTTDKMGNTVCVVQAWQYSAVVGELNVEFDDNGDVLSCEGTPHLLVGDSFEQNDAKLEGAAYFEMLGRLHQDPLISVMTADAKAHAVLESYKEKVEVLSQTIIGQSAENMCFERIPGQGRSQICPVEATAQQGSDITALVSLAFKEQSKAELAIQNAGGVRQDLSQGDISIEDAYTLLPFANTLTVLQMTGQEIVDVLEEGLDFALNPDGSTGAYPYASGLRYAVDASQEMGSRLSDVQVKLPGESDWTPIDLQRSYSVVTNSFLAAGRDGYVTFGKVYQEGRFEDTFLDYAQAFVDYVRRVGTLEKLPGSEYSTQSYVKAE